MLSDSFILRFFLHGLYIYIYIMEYFYRKTFYKGNLLIIPKIFIPMSEI